MPIQVLDSTRIYNAIIHAQRWVASVKISEFGYNARDRDTPLN